MEESPKSGFAGDEFQERLKDLGYLENPLDKFFIGGAHGRTGVLLANLKIALKVGVLGGVFLGVVTALTLSAVASETVSGTGTLARLALCLVIIFTVLFTALELVICLAVTLLGRLFRRFFTRTEMIALYSGIFAGAAVFLYGTLWWWAESAETGLVSLEALAAFVVIALVAAAIAFLTRRAVTALLAVLGGADLGARGKGRATKLYFAALAAGVVMFAGYRLRAAERPPETPSDFTKQSTGLSVTLIAVDGGSLDFFERLASRGRLPNLKALSDEGFVAGLAEPPLHVNPAVWTTVATGVEPEKHGVTAYSAQEIPGLGFYIRERVGFGLYDALVEALPAVGLSKRAPLERRSLAFATIWDIIAMKGDLSGVVNWWGTWPANNFHGFLVTDRMYPKLQVARLSRGQPEFEEEIHPQALFNRLKDYPLEPTRISEAPLAAAEDMDRFAVTAALAGRDDYRNLTLLAVYLPGLDVYLNALEERQPPGAGLAAEADIIEGATRYWEFLDALLEPVVRRRGTENVVILVADPGMLKGFERESGRVGERGFVIMAGGPVVHDEPSEPLALVDIAPTVLYLLGFPISGEMDGRVPLEAINGEFAEKHPLVAIETYGRERIAAQGGYSVDRELVERLRSLGYLQ